MCRFSSFYFVIFAGILSCFHQVKCSEADHQRIGCYINYWSINSGAYPLSKIEPNWCTHVYYAFMQIQNNILAPYKDDTRFAQNIAGLRQIRDKHPNLKILLSVGGGKAGSEAFLAVAATEETRRAFAESTVRFLQTYDVDGLDIDWESGWCYPGWSSDKHASFIEELWSQFKSKGGTRELLLVAAFLPITTYVTFNETCNIIDPTPRPFYEVERLNKSLDFALLMTYDMRGDWNGVTGLHSQLFGPEVNENWEDVINSFLSAGLARSKADAGIPLYGRSYVLEDGNKNGVGAPIKRAGSNPTPSFAQICVDVKFNGWTKIFDDIRRCPYAYKGEQWVGYEDVESATEKGNYVKANLLGGAFFWSMEMEDMANTCEQGYSPVVDAVAKILRPPPTGSLSSTKSSATTKPLPFSSSPLSTNTRFTSPRPSTESSTTLTTITSSTTQSLQDLHPVFRGTGSASRIQYDSWCVLLILCLIWRWTSGTDVEFLYI